ncbi:DUF1488 family protein [Oricola sp.]|uniref:DUF1488 family protein n=1 Tax=Oricola sp. TaxID=1979950 RepID=UPI0025D2710B|nr:DUF1488 family protein [Oricola sp.]MCI5075261.1 DUF1488 domain-containing protein [Oricola sp.]
MALKFLDDMSYFDHRRQQMRFVAHDGSKAVSFRIELDAFYSPGIEDSGGETDYLGAFYQNLDAIHAAAQAAYQKGGRSSYFLSNEDLRS